MFEVQDVNGNWWGAATTGITYTFTAPNGETTVLTTSTPADNSGVSSVSFTPNVPGVWTVKCDWDHNNNIYVWTSSAVMKISVSSSPVPVSNARAVRWTWESCPTSMVANTTETYSVMFEVQDVNGNWWGAATTGITYTFTAPNGETTVLTTSTPADNSGVSSVSFTPNVPGVWTVKCDWDHNNNIYVWTSSSLVSVDRVPVVLDDHDHIVHTDDYINDVDIIDLDDPLEL